MEQMATVVSHGIPISLQGHSRGVPDRQTLDTMGTNQYTFKPNPNQTLLTLVLIQTMPWEPVLGQTKELTKA
jgi:hypothetical protein